MQANTLNTNDIIDVRDIIARFETLEEETTNDDAVTRAIVADESLSARRYELAQLTEILEDLKGNGGDEEWCGDWYPVTLIRDSYFKTYAQELAEDCGMIDRSAHWPNTCIDWTQAARELQHDYLSIDIGGVIYWYR